MRLPTDDERREIAARIRASRPFLGSRAGAHPGPTPTRQTDPDRFAIVWDEWSSPTDDRPPVVIVADGPGARLVDARTGAITPRVHRETALALWALIAGLGGEIPLPV